MTMHLHLSHADHLLARAETLIEAARQARTGGAAPVARDEYRNERQQTLRANLGRGLAKTPVLGDMSGWTTAHAG